MQSQRNLISEDNQLIGSEIHLYNQAVVYQNWLLVPVNLEEELYITCCFTPGGYSFLKTSPYSSIKEALVAGKQLVRRETIDVVLALPFIFNVL
jgi:hypothetical protein